jgi:hypothetical protein
MKESLVPEFDNERLERQRQFLLDRAAAHARSEGDKQIWHDACAASLTRDAALIAILRGNANEAKRLFREAGSRFAALGVFAGFSLLDFSKSGAARTWRTEHEGVDGRILEALTSGEEGVHPEEKSVQPESAREPFLLASAGSPRQLLNLYYAEAIPQDVGGYKEPHRKWLQSLPPEEQAFAIEFCVDSRDASGAFQPIHEYYENLKAELNKTGVM